VPSKILGALYIAAGYFGLLWGAGAPKAFGGLFGMIAGAGAVGGGVIALVHGLGILVG
jgi:hypothetical protein